MKEGFDLELVILSFISSSFVCPKNVKSDEKCGPVLKNCTTILPGFASSFNSVGFDKIDRKSNETSTVGRCKMCHSMYSK